MNWLFSKHADLQVKAILDDKASNAGMSTLRNLAVLLNLPPQSFNANGAYGILTLSVMRYERPSV